MQPLDIQVIEKCIDLKCQEWIKKGFTLGSGRHRADSNIRCALETFAPYTPSDQYMLNISHAQKALKLTALQNVLIAEGFDGLRFMMANQEKFKKFWKIGDRLRRKYIKNV